MENLPKWYGSEGEERMEERIERHSFGYNVDLHAAEEEGGGGGGACVGGGGGDWARSKGTTRRKRERRKGLMKVDIIVGGKLN